VILVAPFSTERADPSAWTSTTLRLAAEPTLVWLHLPPDELVRRLTRRAEARDENKIRDPASFLTALDLAPPSVPHLALDATQPTAPRCKPSLATSPASPPPPPGPHPRPAHTPARPARPTPARAPLRPGRISVPSSLTQHTGTSVAATATGTM